MIAGATTDLLAVAKDLAERLDRDALAARQLVAALEGLKAAHTAHTAPAEARCPLCATAHSTSPKNPDPLHIEALAQAAYARMTAAPDVALSALEAVRSLPQYAAMSETQRELTVRRLQERCR